MTRANPHPTHRRAFRAPPALRTIRLGRLPDRFTVQLGGLVIGTVEQGRADRHGRCPWIARTPGGDTRVLVSKDAALEALRDLVTS